MAEPTAYFLIYRMFAGFARQAHQSFDNIWPGTVALLAALALWLWLPGGLGIGYLGAAMFSPDIGYTLTALATLCAGGALLRLLLTGWARWNAS